MVQDSQSVYINYVPFEDGSFEGFHGFTDKEDEWEILETSQRVIRNYTNGNVFDKQFTVMLFSIKLKRNAGKIFSKE